MLINTNKKKLYLHNVDIAFLLLILVLYVLVIARKQVKVLEKSNL